MPEFSYTRFDAVAIRTHVLLLPLRDEGHDDDTVLDDGLICGAGEVLTGPSFPSSAPGRGTCRSGLCRCLRRSLRDTRNGHGAERSRVNCCPGFPSCPRDLRSCPTGLPTLQRIEVGSYGWCVPPPALTGAARGCPRDRPMVVRHHHRLPLPLRPDHDRAVSDHRVLRDCVAAHPQRAVAAADPVLRQAVPDQLRARRGDRDRAGVPVRDGLERLLPVRR
jgi:hypothetical protein